jgi:hypothetical protein
MWIVCDRRAESESDNAALKYIHRNISCLISSQDESPNNEGSSAHSVMSSELAAIYLARIGGMMESDAHLVISSRTFGSWKVRENSPGSSPAAVRHLFTDFEIDHPSFLFVYLHAT